MSNGRVLTDYEQEAWKDYNRLLDELHKEYNVKTYNRPSVHEAFPELKAAFERCCAASTFYRLTKCQTQPGESN